MREIRIDRQMRILGMMRATAAIVREMRIVGIRLTLPIPREMRIPGKQFSPLSRYRERGPGG